MEDDDRKTQQQENDTTAEYRTIGGLKCKITATSFPGPFFWLEGKDPGNEVEVRADLRDIKGAV